jgi:hypothetical protein
MPLRAAYTAAAAPAGPPPTISTSNGVLGAEFGGVTGGGAGVELGHDFLQLMRPEPNTAPFRNTMGTAMIWRSVTSSWNSAAFDHRGLDAPGSGWPSGSAPAPRPGSCGRTALM